MTHYLTSAWEFASVSDLFYQAQLSFQVLGHPPKLGTQGLPNGVPGTSGLQAHLSPPESIHELINNPPSLYCLQLSTN